MTFWNRVKDKVIGTLVTLIFVGLGSAVPFAYDIYHTVKHFPELEDKIDAIIKHHAVSFRKELETHSEVSREIFVPLVGDLIKWNVKYERIGLYRDRQSEELWYIAPDGKVYQPFYDESSTNYKYKDRSNVWHWCN